MKDKQEGGSTKVQRRLYEAGKGSIVVTLPKLIGKELKDRGEGSVIVTKLGNSVLISPASKKELPTYQVELPSVGDAFESDDDLRRNVGLQVTSAYLAGAGEVIMKTSSQTQIAMANQVLNELLTKLRGMKTPEIHPAWDGLVARFDFAPESSVKLAHENSSLIGTMIVGLVGALSNYSQGSNATKKVRREALTLQQLESLFKTSGDQIDNNTYRFFRQLAAVASLKVLPEDIQMRDFADILSYYRIGSSLERLGDLLEEELSVLTALVSLGRIDFEGHSSDWLKLNLISYLNAVGAMLKDCSYLLDSSNPWNDSTANKLNEAREEKSFELPNIGLTSYCRDPYISQETRLRFLTSILEQRDSVVVSESERIEDKVYAMFGIMTNIFEAVYNIRRPKVHVETGGP